MAAALASMARPRCGLFGLLLISHAEDGVAQPFLERRVVAELLEQLGVVGQEVDHDALQRGVVLDPGGFLVVVLHGVLVGGIRRYLGRDLLGDNLADLVAVFPIDVAELVVERLDDVAQLVQLRFRFAATATGRHRSDFGILIRKADLQAGFHLDTVAVHVDGLQDAPGQVLFLGRGELRDQEIQEDRQLLPVGIRVRQDRGQKSVGADESLGLALEVHLAIFVEIGVVGGHAGVQDRVELVAVRAVQVEPHQVVDLLLGVDLVAVQIRLQVVQFIRVGFVTEDSGAVIGLERLLDGLRVVVEIEHKGVVLLRVGAIEP